MPTAIFPCTCKNSFQDKEYGIGMRVFNEKNKLKAYLGYACTVCSRIINPSVQKKEEVKAIVKEINLKVEMKKKKKVEEKKKIR